MYNYYLKIILMLVFLASCAHTPVPKITKHRPEMTFQEKMGIKTERCMHQLLKSGVDQTLIFPICGQIYIQPSISEPILENNVL